MRVLNLEVQFWTSRGFAVVDVNYGGSTGYGRAYRERLNGQWGIVDVADASTPRSIWWRTGKADRGAPDHSRRQRRRLHDAGGADVSRDVFKAGASYYGISDLEVLARDTHKFESRYLDRLVGPYPGDARCLSRAIADPLRRAARVPAHSVPGPRGSGGAAESVADDGGRRPRERACRSRSLTFEGEQHGFRKAETIVRCLEVELYFYGVVFGFTPAGVSAEFDIDNLER